MKLSEPITSPIEAAAYLRKAIPRGRIGLQECLVALPLDVKFRVIGRPVLVAIGTARSVEGHPRDIFREAVRRGAYGLVVAHNHPSGDLHPSDEDIEFADRIKLAGNVLGIEVLDSIVLGRDGYNARSEGGWDKKEEDA